jgi:hypothetical protein
MGTIVVVVAHELAEQRDQMPLIQHDDAIKAFPDFLAEDPERRPYEAVYYIPS